jgi:lipopolysaccharide/colanic/teichoic acid biosynthesis glycosyltransferase
MVRFFRVFVPVGALALLFSETLLIGCCFLVVTFLVMNVDPQVFLFVDNGLLRIGVALASILFGLFFEDLYVFIQVKSRVLLLQQLCLVMGIALLIQGLIGYFNAAFPLPLRLMIPAGALVIAGVFTWRIVYSHLVLRLVGAQRLLLVGASALLRELAAHIESRPELGMRIIGYVGKSEDGGGLGKWLGKWLGPLSSLEEAARAEKPDRIVVGLAERRGEMPIGDLLRLRYAGVPVEEAAAIFEQLFGRVLLAELRPADVVLSGAFRPRPQGLIIQTVVHWLLALLLTIVTAPLLLLAALLVKLSDGGPVLNLSERIGLRGRPFRLYSLRISGCAGLPQHFMKRWRLRSLPGLWNILLGDMCFVGPEPDRPEIAQALSARIPFYKQRYSLKPGLTGWAQINLPPDKQEDSLEYDFYYLKNFSRALDTYILAHTIKELLIAAPPRSPVPASDPAWHTNS